MRAYPRRVRHNERALVRRGGRPSQSGRPVRSKDFPVKTMPVMLRLDPKDWKRFRELAAERDLRPAQLIRQVMREWLDKAKKK